jgi:hypothetical protein
MKALINEVLLALIGIGIALLCGSIMLRFVDPYYALIVAIGVGRIAMLVEYRIRGKAAKARQLHLKQLNYSKIYKITLEPQGIIKNLVAHFLLEALYL